MNHKIATFGASLLFCFSAAVSAQVVCQPENLAGNWTLVTSGTATLVAADANMVGQTVPVAGLGVATIDQAGVLSVAGSITMGKDTKDYEAKGTMTMNANCTGVISYSMKVKGSTEAFGFVERFVLDRFRQEITGISIKSPNSTPMWSVSMKRFNILPTPVSLSAITQ